MPKSQCLIVNSHFFMVKSPFTNGYRIPYESPRFPALHCPCPSALKTAFNGTAVEDCHDASQPAELSQGAAWHWSQQRGAQAEQRQVDRTQGVAWHPVKAKKPAEIWGDWTTKNGSFYYKNQLGLMITVVIMIVLFDMCIKTIWGKDLRNNISRYQDE